jgi:hypothetical protein
VYFKTLQKDSEVSDTHQVPQQEQTQTEDHSRVVASETKLSVEETRTNNRDIENTETTEGHRKH